MSILAHLHYGRKGCLRKVTKSWGTEEAGRNTFKQKSRESFLYVGEKKTTFIKKIKIK